MSTLLLERSFLKDYVRNATNLLLLVLVPVTFVIVAAPRLADAAKILGGAETGVGIETVTAGWAAGFLSAVAMYFQVSSSRVTDRRLVLAGMPRGRLARGRLLTGAALAAVASTAALIALVARHGLGHPWRVILGTAMFALVYLAIGAAVGALVATPVNGTVLVLFVWILDVFFGPTLSGSDSAVLRFLPTHFISLWTVNQPAGHGGPSALAWSWAWVIGSLVAAYFIVASTTRRRRKLAPTGQPSRLWLGVRLGLTEWRRTPLLWVLLAAVPTVFILLSDAITPHGISPVLVREGGIETTVMLDPAVIHPGTMAPVAIASLTALVGVFIVLDARAGDRRLVLAGQPVITALATRILLVALAALGVTAFSLTVTATVFTARQWGVYGLGSLLLAITYGLIGMLLGPIFGRVSGVFVAFLLPFIDLGLGQSPMLGNTPVGWAHWMPGYAGMRVLIDGALSAGFDEGGMVLVALGWIAVLAGLVLLVLRRTVRS